MPTQRKRASASERVATPAPSPSVILASHDSEITVLRQELERLRTESVAQALAHQQEMATLRAETDASIAALHAAIAPVAQTTSGEPPSDTPTKSSDSTSADPSATTSRRGLLKWGGLGAAAALAAAGGSALTSQTAHAADGGNFVLGHINTAESATVLNFDGTPPITSLVVNGPTDANSTAISGSSGLQGVTGNASAASGTGVAGDASGTNGTGVAGFSTTWYGVAGFTGSTSGADLAAIGTGRIFLKLGKDQPGPPNGPSVAGQLSFVPDGLFLCVQSGNPGTWLNVTTGGGAVNFLSNPIRLLDTRTSGAWLAGSTHALAVVGVSVGGVSVPNGATGVIGNVTVVSPSAGGDLRLYPGGTPAPSTSSINFATNQIIANGVMVGFGFNLGFINIKVDMPTNTHTHVLFDASGYIS